MLMSKPKSDQPLKERVESMFDFSIPEEKYQEAWNILEFYDKLVIKIVNELGAFFEKWTPPENVTYDTPRKKYEATFKDAKPILWTVPTPIAECGVYIFSRLHEHSHDLLCSTWDYHPISVKRDKVLGTFEFQLKDGLETIENAYKDIVANEDSGYGQSILTYINEWGKAIDRHMEKGESFESCWNAASHEADNISGGITGFMYNMAVQRLSRYHVHGEELRVLHNAHWGVTDSDGIVNSSIITLS